jgi:hypothetical protein
LRAFGDRRFLFFKGPAGGRDAAEEETMTPALLQNEASGFGGVILGRMIVIITLFERSMMMILLA